MLIHCFYVIFGKFKIFYFIQQYEVEKIVAGPKNGGKLFKVRWKNFTSAYDTWEDAEASGLLDTEPYKEYVTFDCVQDIGRFLLWHQQEYDPIAHRLNFSYHQGVRGIEPYSKAPGRDVFIKGLAFLLSSPNPGVCLV